MNSIVMLSQYSSNDCATNVNCDGRHAGQCNVVAGGPIVLAGVVGLGKSNRSLTVLSKDSFSREPVAIVTRSDDSEWSNLVNLVVNSFFLAEFHGISKSNSHLLAAKLQIDVGTDEATIMESVVSVFGNYGDLYATHLEPILPRHGLNMLYKNHHDTAGLLYYLPLGDYEAKGPGFLFGTAIRAIQTRGHLRCGVATDPLLGTAGTAANNATASVLDFHVEFCRAVAAALFAGKATSDTVQKEYLTSSINSTGNHYRALANGDVDLVAGARTTLQANYREPTTAQGYTFSTPYFFDMGNSSKDANSVDAFALMTKESDPHWSAFVNWIVMAMLYAEDQGIGMNTSGLMPIVGVFGEDSKQMLRDCILAVGSYAQVYNRTMETHLSRSGSVNRLNEGLRGPQHYPIPFN
jgi:hypothetical protein